MCKPVWKKTLLAVLVLAFGVQTSLVYSDARSEPLSEAAHAGRVLWHQHACQTCHQLYGQGGFLGPDLTNAASRVDSTRLASLLQVGSGQMPPLGFDESEVAAMSAFLQEIDRPEIGRGQLRMGSPDEPGGVQAAFESAIEAELGPGDAEAAAGFAAWRARPCFACHIPFRDSPVGAPDLSLVAGALSADSLDRVLETGRPERGMPPPVPPLSAEERASIAAFLGFLEAHRADLEAATRSLTPDRSIDWRALPWWEFP